VNAPALITQRPIMRPHYTNAPITLETFERWFIANYYELRRYCLQLEQLADEEPIAPGDFLLWAQCQYDIAKRSPTSSDPQSSRNRISSAPAGESDGATAGLGAAKVSVSYPVTCRARYYDAASRILEDELRLFTHANADELGLLIEQWIEKKRANWEPR
jgi:hypothetical protein